MDGHTLSGCWPSVFRVLMSGGPPLKDVRCCIDVVRVGQGWRAAVTRRGSLTLLRVTDLVAWYSICTYLHTYTQTPTYLYAHAYTHTSILTHLHSHTYTHTPTLTHLHSHTYTHTPTRIYANAYMHIRTYLHTYAQALTHTRTYAHPYRRHARWHLRLPPCLGVIVSPSYWPSMLVPPKQCSVCSLYRTRVLSIVLYIVNAMSVCCVLYLSMFVLYNWSRTK